MDIEPDEEVVAEAPALMRSEESLFVSNRQRLAETLSIHEEGRQPGEKRAAWDPGQAKTGAAQHRSGGKGVGAQRTAGQAAAGE